VDVFLLGKAELGEDRVEVFLHSALGQKEPSRDGGRRILKDSTGVAVGKLAKKRRPGTDPAFFW